MKRMSENDITRLCYVAQVLVVDPDGYELLAKLALNPAEAKLVARQLYQLSLSRSTEFKQAVKLLKNTFRQLQPGPVTVAKIALAAEKMTKKSNATTVFAGQTLLWAVSNHVSRDWRSGGNKISKLESKIVSDVVKRVVRRNP